jgi:hypothetical protein
MRGRRWELGVMKPEQGDWSGRRVVAMIVITGSLRAGRLLLLHPARSCICLAWSFRTTACLDGDITRSSCLTQTWPLATGAVAVLTLRVLAVAAVGVTLSVGVAATTTTGATALDFLTRLCGVAMRLD